MIVLQNPRIGLSSSLISLGNLISCLSNVKCISGCLEETLGMFVSKRRGPGLQRY